MLLGIESRVQHDPSPFLLGKLNLKSMAVMPDQAHPTFFSLHRLDAPDLLQLRLPNLLHRQAQNKSAERIADEQGPTDMLMDRSRTFLIQPQRITRQNIELVGSLDLTDLRIHEGDEFCQPLRLRSRSRWAAAGGQQQQRDKKTQGGHNEVLMVAG